MIRLAVVEDQNADPRNYGRAARRTARLGRVGAGLRRCGADARRRAADSTSVVLDLHLRGGGAENSDAVRLVSRSSKVVVLSGRQSAEAVQRAVAAGALGYVSKESPTDSIGRLAKAIAHVLGGKPYFDPELQDRMGAAARRQLESPPAGGAAARGAGPDRPADRAGPEPERGRGAPACRAHHRDPP